MRYHVLAADYDGTLAKDGHVDESTVDALRRLRDSGRKLILVTGRRLEPVLDLFPDISLFNRIVAENGTLLFDPSTGEETLAVDNALPKVKEMADLVTVNARGQGVEELIDMMLDDDLSLLRDRPERRLVFGSTLDGKPYTSPLSRFIMAWSESCLRWLWCTSRTSETDLNGLRHDDGLDR